jgi:hypothetical protein
MTELICKTFLIAFLIFYWTLFLALLYGGIRGGLRGRLKSTRVVRMPDPYQALALSPRTHQY